MASAQNPGPNADLFDSYFRSVDLDRLESEGGRSSLGGMASAQNPALNADLFDSYFRRADLDRDGRISGLEAVSFFQASGLPKPVLVKIWDYADQSRIGFLGRAEFYNAR